MFASQWKVPFEELVAKVLAPLICLLILPWNGTTFGQAEPRNFGEPTDENFAPKPEDKEVADEEVADEDIAEESSPLMSLMNRTNAGQWLECRRIRLYGWTDVSFTASSTDPEQLPMGFNYRANEFLLQQNWIVAERSLDLESESPDFGFRMDTILPGTDYRFTLARGLLDGQLTENAGQPNRYGIDPIQFYLQGWLPGLGNGTEVKLGRFVSPYGAEAIAAPLAPLNSRAYTFIYNPFTHFGLLATTQVNDNWSVWQGYCTGCDVILDPSSNFYFIGGAKWAPQHSRTTAQFVTLLGSGRFDSVEQFHNPQMFNFLVTHQFNDRLKYTFDSVYGYTQEVPGIGDASWYGLVNYLTWQVSEQLSRTVRIEFFDDLDGQRTGFAGLYSALTGGVTYKPRKWLWLRPELRYDHHSADPFSGESGLLTATFDMILNW